VDTSRAPTCELCEAAPITDWFHEDEECWVAECESCSVPMVVWKRHDPSPPDAVRARLHAALAAVVAEHYDYEHTVDDVLRTIPTHYHAHARGRHGPWTVKRRSG
jgi:hypothetical protein